MKLRRLSLTLVTLFMAYLAGGAGWAGPAGDGVITGQVINKTSGARPVSGLEITLTRLVDGTEESKMTTTTDGAGRYAFGGLVRGSSRTYTITVRYKGGEYTAEQLTFAGNENTKTVPITVYESTTDERVLRVMVQHLIVSPGQGGVRVMEVLGVANPTDHTYIGSKPAPGDRRETLRFPLPSGATEVQYGEGLMECCVVAGKDGFIDTMDVKPGTRQIAFSYMVPAERSAARVARPVAYPTDVVEILVADVGVQAGGPGLVARETVETQQGRYLRLSRTALRPGSTIALELSGLPSGSPLTRWFAGGMVLVAVAVGLFMAARRGGGTTDESSVVDPAAEMRRTLIEELADLDERAAAGQIPEDEYAAERARKKRALAELLRGPQVQ